MGGNHKPRTRGAHTMMKRRPEWSLTAIDVTEVHLKSAEDTSRPPSSPISRVFPEIQRVPAGFWPETPIKRAKSARCLCRHFCRRPTTNPSASLYNAVRMYVCARVSVRVCMWGAGHGGHRAGPQSLINNP